MRSGEDPLAVNQGPSTEMTRFGGVFPGIMQADLPSPSTLGRARSVHDLLSILFCPTQNTTLM